MFSPRKWCWPVIKIPMGGSFATALSRDSDIQGSNSMSQMTIMNDQNSNPILKFFNSPLGDILLVISSASMILGIWFSGKMKLIPLAVSGIAIMFLGMYSYYSISLQIAGATVMVFAHVFNHSYKVSKLLKII